MIKNRINKIVDFYWLAAARYPVLSLSASALFLFYPVKQAMLHARGDEGSRVVFLVLTLAFAGIFYWVKAETVERPVRFLYRGIVLLFSAYLLLSTPSFLAENMNWRDVAELRLYQWVLPFLGVMAWWRPLWGIPLLLAAKWQKNIIASNTGMNISVTDYSPVLEIGILLLAVFLHAVDRRKKSIWQAKLDQSVMLSSLDVVFLTAVAVHFANYFYSGLQKIELVGNLTDWVMLNPTYYLSLAAWHVGALPLSVIGDEVTGRILEWVRAITIPLNIIVFVSQLVAIIALMRIRVMIFLTLIYDLMHVAIFILSGIFFYKWIILNLLIVASLAMMRHKIISVPIKLWLMSVLLCAPMLFFVALLGWYDTPSFDDEYLEVVTKSDEVYRVPSNYALSASVTYAQQRLAGGGDGHFNTRSYGAIGGILISRESFARVQACHRGEISAVSAADKARRAKLDDFIVNHHQYILNGLDESGRLYYDAFPHHIFSMPWSFMDFYRLDKRDIVSYRYVRESLCLGLEEGKLIAIRKARSEYNVPVR